MSELGALEKLAFGLTHCRREAISLGDDLLVYLLTMAISHVGKKSNALRKAAEGAPAAQNRSPSRSAQVHELPSGPTETILTSLFTALCQFGNEVDGGGAKRRIADSQKGAYQT
jgi:hypothetical protein